MKKYNNFFGKVGIMALMMAAAFNAKSVFAQTSLPTTGGNITGGSYNVSGDYFGAWYNLSGHVTFILTGDATINGSIDGTGGSSNSLTIRVAEYLTGNRSLTLNNVNNSFAGEINLNSNVTLILGENGSIPNTSLVWMEPFQIGCFGGK